MKTESNGNTSSTDRRQMDEESRERANGFLPAGVALVPKEELQRYLKCKRIGNYLLGKTIGEGSFARVKQGFHVLTGEKVAIKIIDKKQAHQDKYVARNMRREAKIMQMIRHPNIVQLLEVVETEHRYYLITELAAGGDLMDYICYRRKLGEVEVRKFIRQTVSAVHYLHQGGILHRDLKVENLLLDDDYNIKIIDFGLSNTMFIPSSDGQSTRQFLKTQCGSPAYAAPEILGHKPYGPEVDVWSIGVNMFAMLTGKLPYTAEPFHITTLYNKMKNNDMNPIPDHLSAPCKDLIRRFLTFHREQRITLEEALGHEWLRKGYDGPVIPVLFPSYPRDEEMDKNILRHMTDKMDFQQLEIVDAVTQNRSTSAATVYHLLKRKLKKFYIKHPEKAKLITNGETNKGSIESVKDSQGIAQEKEYKNPIKNRAECIVATAVVCDFNDKEEMIQKEQYEGNDSDSKKLEVPTCRKRLSSASSENLAAPNGELPEGKTDTPKDDTSAKLESETDGVEKDGTCNIFSSAGIEISRKNSCNYSSVEVMAIKGRKLSLNLSHISVESKATLNEESLKNSSVKNVDEHGERKETTVEDKMVSARRVDTMPNLSQEKTQKSPRHTAPNTPSKVGKVSLINSKVISIPLQQTKLDSSADKAKLTHRKFSLPQSYLPPRNLGTNKERQPVTSPFSFTSPSSSTDTKRRNRNSLPPYGLCCQLTAIKAQDENDETASRAKEDKSRTDHEAQCIGPDARTAQTWRNVYRSPASTDKGKQRRKTIATSGGKELLKSINNTLGKLMEVQDKTEPAKAHAQDSLLLRSRLPPTTLNGPKRESPIDGVKISLIQDDAATERVKERRSSGLKISCRMKDTHSHMPQVLSTSNSESNSTKEQERTVRRRRRRTLENKVPIITSKDVLSRRDDSGNPRRHVRDKYESSHQSPRGERPSRDSLEEVI